MEYILLEGPDNLDLPWPGLLFDMRSADRRALLGSVHGMGVAYLVKDHSDVLGRKVPAVRIFTVAEGEDPRFRMHKWGYYMVWELRDTVEG